MVTVIFRVKMQAGKEEQALKAVEQMIASVKEQEPGALLYAVHRPQDDPSELVFFEAYQDEAAFQAHMGTPHMAQMRASFGELFDPTTVKIERLERVAGVMREG